MQTVSHFEGGPVLAFCSKKAPSIFENVTPKSGEILRNVGAKSKGRISKAE